MVSILYPASVVVVIERRQEHIVQKRHIEESFRWWVGDHGHGVDGEVDEGGGVVDYLEETVFADGVLDLVEGWAAGTQVYRGKGNDWDLLDLGWGVWVGWSQKWVQCVVAIHAEVDALSSSLEVGVWLKDCGIGNAAGVQEEDVAIVHAGVTPVLETSCVRRVRTVLVFVCHVLAWYLTH